MKRPSLEKLFGDEIVRDKRKRDKRVVVAVEGSGYSQREVANYLGMHFTSISRIMGKK
jgi:putative transposase